MLFADDVMIRIYCATKVTDTTSKRHIITSRTCTRKTYDEGMSQKEKLVVVFSIFICEISTFFSFKLCWVEICTSNTTDWWKIPLNILCIFTKPINLCGKQSFFSQLSIMSLFQGFCLLKTDINSKYLRTSTAWLVDVWHLWRLRFGSQQIAYK